MSRGGGMTLGAGVDGELCCRVSGAQGSTSQRGAHIVAKLLADRVTQLRWEQDQAILMLADAPPSTPGAMLNRIRDLGMKETDFYQRLNVLLDTERALAAFPVTVSRLRRLREQRTTPRGRG